LSTYSKSFKIEKIFSRTSKDYLEMKTEQLNQESKYTNEKGILSFYEICKILNLNVTKNYWDDMVKF
jgi:hypothetical protein